MKDLTVIIGDSATINSYKKIQAIDSIERTQEFRRKESLRKTDTIRIIREKKTGNLLPPLKDIPKMEIDQHNKIKGSRLQDFGRNFFGVMYRDSVNFKMLDSIFTSELKKKHIHISFDFLFKKHSNRKYIYGKDPNVKKLLEIMSTSLYVVMGRNELTLYYEDPSALTFRRSVVEIILSLLISLTVIGCLGYLLRTVNRQKKLEEIRNDLISNITHEFKTPITTVISAIEGIRNFNTENDKEKTERYLDISQRQMEKLQAMVEKLLDTATLNANSLILKKEPADLVAMLNAITERHAIGNNPKIIAAVSDLGAITIQADAFHLENAISNIIDNAVKYGGQTVNVRLETGKTHVCIFVEDDGIGIESAHRDRIFEKFYRVPTGNIHNVKGFGIGLFYSREIIEKHDGRLELVANNQLTIFKITLPYA